MSATIVFGPSGEVAEWSIAAVLKTVEPVRVPWVRIPPSPPNSPLASLAGAAGLQARSDSVRLSYRARIPPSRSRQATHPQLAPAARWESRTFRAEKDSVDFSFLQGCHTFPVAAQGCTRIWSWDAQTTLHALSPCRWRSGGNGSLTLSAQSSRLVVASGLDNPRGLNFGPDGFLYVAEAGRGGVSALCLPQGGAPPTAPPSCYGPTGAVTRVRADSVRARVVQWPALARTSRRRRRHGPHDISFGAGGAAYVTVGLGANPALRAPFEAAGIRFGRLFRISPATDRPPTSSTSPRTKRPPIPDGGADRFQSVRSAAAERRRRVHRCRWQRAHPDRADRRDLDARRLSRTAQSLGPIPMQTRSDDGRSST